MAILSYSCISGTPETVVQTTLKLDVGSRQTLESDVSHNSLVNYPERIEIVEYFNSGSCSKTSLFQRTSSVIKQPLGCRLEFGQTNGC